MHFRSSIVICGGEPLTSPNFLPLLDFIKNEFPNATISILTNGTLITEKLAQELLKFSNLEFQVSLDGPDSDRHDKIRGAGKFEAALNGIRLLKKYGFPVYVLSVLSQNTYPWMEDFFRLAQSEKFNSINFVRFVPEGFGKKLVEASKDEQLLGDDLKSAYEKLLHLMAKYQIKSKCQVPLMELVYPGLGRSGKYWESIVVDYQGYIIASSRAKLRLGHAINDGLENIFTTHPIYKSLRQGKIDGCGKCLLKNVCGGDRNAAYAATGNFLGKDPGCWKNNNKQNPILRWRGI